MELILILAKNTTYYQESIVTAYAVLRNLDIIRIILIYVKRYFT